MSIPLEQLLPISIERFKDEYKDKKYFVAKSKENIFKDHFSWKELDQYLNSNKLGGWDRMPQLQIVTPTGKYCHMKAKIKLTREEIFEHWQNGCSFILTLSEFLNKTMWQQCQEFEKHYGMGQANLYCSNMKGAKCFPIHADSTDNFLFHVRGNVRWYIYNEFQYDCPKRDEATVETVIDLSEGDLLYIPKKLYHRVDTLSPRISISFHFTERKKPHKRVEWLDWLGEINGTAI
jgi:hypothetical protein